MSTPFCFLKFSFASFLKEFLLLLSSEKVIGTNFIGRVFGKSADIVYNLLC